MRGGDRSGLGRWGEDQAARYLQARGCTILAARFRCREGEIDLVAREGVDRLTLWQVYGAMLTRLFCGG